MKKKKLVSLLPLVLLFTSCKGVDTEEVFNESKQAISQLQDVTYSSYSMSVIGHVLQFDNIRTTSGSVPDDSIDNSTRNRSAVYRVPLRLSEENYYPDDDEEVSSLDNYTYTRLSNRLTGDSDPMTKMQFRMDGDNLVFYSTGLSRKLTFYNIYLYTVEGIDVYSSVAVYARFNITLTYNNQGLLIKEEVKNVIVDSSAMEKTIDVVSEYTYTE